MLMDKLPVPDSFKLSVILLSNHSEWQHMAIVVQAVLLEDKMDIARILFMMSLVLCLQIHRLIFNLLYNHGHL